MHNTVCTVNSYLYMYIYAHCWPIGIWLISHDGVCYQYMKDMFLIMYHQCIQLNTSYSTYQTVFFMLLCGDRCSPCCCCCGDHCCSFSGVLICTTASLVALWVVTGTVFEVVTAVLSWQSLKLKQKGMLGHMDDIDMNVSTCT